MVSGSIAETVFAARQQRWCKKFMEEIHMQKFVDEFVEDEVFAARCDLSGRTRGSRRKTDFQKASRKQRIDAKIHVPSVTRDGILYSHPWYGNLHQYSKNKIHCSCALCRFYGPSMSDVRRSEAMDAKEKKFSKEEGIYAEEVSCTCL